MKKNLVKKFLSVATVLLLCMGLSSCEVMTSVMQGMASYPMYGYGTASGYNAGTTTTSTSSSYSSSSSSTSTKRTCSRCKGTGNCQTCGGTGRKYDYGPASITTHKKYDQRCGVCNGRGRCGVCDGKGHV